jgi:hypothetical protein
VLTAQPHDEVGDALAGICADIDQHASIADATAPAPAFHTEPGGQAGDWGI